MTRAFVAGATGYTGQAVVRRLRGSGVETIAHVRPDSPRLEPWRERFAGLGARVDQTAWDPEAMRATLAALRPDLVFALLGTTRSRGRRHPGESYESVDEGLTLLLLRATVEAGIRPRFIYLSSVGVRPGTRNRYLAARVRVETEVRASGLPWLIARPSFITGRDRDERRPAERIAAGVADLALAAA
ncbi:MAG TPA: NAD(P)H-binding protein, partial [Gemmatimonadales bacterium]|nr:NAD(P)H-binding protein [Gemmatimonadales bacterium]